MTEALLLRGGRCASARYTSPHVIGWAERIRVDGDEADFERALERVRPAAEELDATQFEVLDGRRARGVRRRRASTSPSSRRAWAAGSTRPTSSTRRWSCSRTSRSSTREHLGATREAIARGEARGRRSRARRSSSASPSGRTRPAAGRRHASSSAGEPRARRAGVEAFLGRRSTRAPPTRRAPRPARAPWATRRSRSGTARTTRQAVGVPARASCPRRDCVARRLDPRATRTRTGCSQRSRALGRAARRDVVRRTSARCPRDELADARRALLRARSRRSRIRPPRSSARAGVRAGRGRPRHRLALPPRRSRRRPTGVRTMGHVGERLSVFVLAAFVALRDRGARVRRRLARGKDLL